MNHKQYFIQTDKGNKCKELPLPEIYDEDSELEFSRKGGLKEEGDLMAARKKKENTYAYELIPNKSKKEEEKR